MLGIMLAERTKNSQFLPIHPITFQLSSANGMDVRIGGGPNTIQQYLRTGLIDELHLVMRPVLLGSGEPLLQGIDLRSLGYVCTRSMPGERATHVFLQRTDRSR